jgi:hypothetical protein
LIWFWKKRRSLKLKTRARSTVSLLSLNIPASQFYSSTVYLTGNYIGLFFIPFSILSYKLTASIADQRAIPFNGEDDSDIDEEDDYDLREVSSDVEIDPDELEIPSDDEEDDSQCVLQPEYSFSC